MRRGVGGDSKNGSSLVEDNKSNRYTIKAVVQCSRRLDKSKTIKELNRGKLSQSRRLRPAGGHTEPKHRKA